MHNSNPFHDSNDSNTRHRNDDDYNLFSHSLDSANWQQDWHQTLNDQASLYTNMQPGSLHAHSLDSSFLSDMFTTSMQDWYAPLGNDTDSLSFTLTNNTDTRPQQDTILDTIDQEQQAILLSDPNFIRQQQLLLEQQKAMQQRMEEDLQAMNMETSGDLLKTDMETFPPRSNLSAMFDHDNAAEADKLSTEMNAQMMQKGAKPSGIAKGQIKRESGRRIQPGALGYGRTSRAAPIPISDKSTDEIDHQRRFSELQQRFRVNFARKPQKHQHKHQGSVPTAIRTAASSFPNSSSWQPEAQFGTSLPSSVSSATGSSSTPTSQTNVQRRRSASIIGDPNSLLPLGNTGHVSMHTGSATNQTIGNAGKTITAPRNISDAASQPASFPSRTMAIQIQRVHRPNGSLPFDSEQRQRKLDEQLEKVNFNDITVSELKEMLRQRGKPATGKKAILMQRLQDERDMIKAMRSGRLQRQNTSDGSGPQSFQAPSPNLGHQGNSLPTYPPSPSAVHPSSLPSTSGFPSSFSSAPPSSPGATTLSLNRSIANMHIGSPPISSQQARRYSPYATPGSPRGEASPKMSNAYSSSVPTGFMSSMATNDTSLSSGAPQRLSRGFTSLGYPSGTNPTGRHKYAPLTPSALATPDHDGEQDPFEQLIMEQSGAPQSLPPAQDIPISSQMEGFEDTNMDFGQLLELGYPNFANMDNLAGFTQEELLALLAENNMREDVNMLQDTPPASEQNNDGRQHYGGLDMGNTHFDGNYSMFDHNHRSSGF